MLNISTLSFNMKMISYIKNIIIIIKFKAMYLSVINCMICKKEKKYDIDWKYIFQLFTVNL